MAVSANRIHIIGIGDDGLDGVTSPARQLIEQAELLVGAEATLAQIPRGKAERLVVGANLDEAIERIAPRRRPNAWSCWPRAIRCSTAWPAICATSWARTASRSCRTSAACSWPLPA